jgi:hypothetical protein
MLGAKHKLNGKMNLSLDSVLFYNLGIIKDSTTNIYKLGGDCIYSNRVFSSTIDTYMHHFIFVFFNTASLFSYTAFFLLDAIYLFFSVLYVLPSFFIGT